MMDSSWQDELTRPLRTLQIIVGTLVGGSVGFLVIVLVLGPGAPHQQGGGGFSITTLAVVFTVVVLVARLIVPGVIAAVERRKIVKGTWTPQRQSGPAWGWAPEFLERTGDAGELTYVFMNRAIVAGALIEGATFFMLIAHMLEGTPLSLIVAVVLIAGLLLHFPTRSRLVGWIEDQLVLIEQERQLTDMR